VLHPERTFKCTFVKGTGRNHEIRETIESAGSKIPTFIANFTKNVKENRILFQQLIGTVFL